MELLISLVILIVLIVGGFMLFNRMRSSPTVGRAARVVQARIDNPVDQKIEDPTVETLRPGDAVALADGTNCVVVSVLECREEVGPRVETWRWSFLDDGQLLEAANDGNVLYARAEIAYQGSDPFNRLVAEASEGGVLKLFEQRVQARQTATTPTIFEHAGLAFHLRSTGAFSASASGQPLGDVWRDISPQTTDNVYFEAEAPTGEQLLGVWTSHIALLVGRPLGKTDIDAIYPGREGAA